MKKKAKVFILLLLILTGCSKDLIYFPGTISEETEKAVEGEYSGIIVAVNVAGETSLYIAAATTRLIATNTLSLDDPLSELIPEIKDRVDYSNEITLRMMNLI